MGREYGAYFTYKFKRGDVCDYCGTIFGYDVEEIVSGSSRQGPEKAEQKAIKEGERVGREEASEPCPNCGRIPSEAYASLLGSWKIFLSVLWVPAGCAFLAFGLIMIFTLVACRVAAKLAELLGLDRLVSEIESLFSYFDALMESDAPGVFMAFVAALIYAAATCGFIARHIRLFRSPAANLRAMEKAKAREAKAKAKAKAKAERKAERKAETSAERKAKRKAETSAERKAETLGYSSKSKIDPNLKGRRTFWALSATQILFMSAGFCFYAALAAYECEASWAERFFNALANFYMAIGVDELSLWEPVWDEETGSGTELDMLALWLMTSLAAYLLALVTWPLYAWAGRDAVRFQGTRHFACGWKFEETRNIWGGKSKDMRKLELDESRRTVETLRAADCLTEAGREMLAIAEKECGESEETRRQEAFLKNGKKRIKYGGRRGRKQRRS